MYQLHKTNSVIGWVPLDYVDILTIKTALVEYIKNSNSAFNEEEDILFTNSVQSIINRIESLDR